MSAISNPFGFRPAFHTTGNSRGTVFTIASGYATAMYRGQPVILNATGTLIAGTAAADIIGVFAGCEYVDATGRPQESDFWPAGQVATQIKAYVYDDPSTVFEVQADGSIPQAAVGHQTDVTNVANGSAQGLSQATVSAGTTATAGQGQFRIVGFGQALDNAAGDAFTVVQVRIARHEYVVSKVSL